MLTVFDNHRSFEILKLAVKECYKKVIGGNAKIEKRHFGWFSNTMMLVFAFGTFHTLFWKSNFWPKIPKIFSLQYDDFVSKKKKKIETNFEHIEILNRASYLKLVRIIYLNVCTKIIQYFKKFRFLATSGRTSRHWKNPQKIQFWSFFHHRRLLKLIFWARNGCLE